MMPCQNVYLYVVYRSFNFMLDCCFTMTANVLQLPEGGDLEALHCQPSTNFDRSTKLDLTTEPPLLGRCCYAQAIILRHCNILFFVLLVYSICLFGIF